MKPLVELKLQSDEFYPATLLKYYEFNDKLAPDVEIKSITAASPRQLLNIISPPPV